MSSKKPKMTIREYLRAIGKVGKTSFSISPSAAIVRIIDSIIQASLPIATTYFAALTTSALVASYNGDTDANPRVFLYIGITVAITIVTLLWGSVNSYISQKTRYIIESAIEDKMLKHFSSLPFPLYDDKDMIDLHDKAKRFSYFFSYIFDTIGSMFTSIIGAIGSVVALAFLNVWLALIVFIAVLPGVIIQIRLARQQAQHWQGNITNRRRRWNLSSMMQESKNMVEMRVYGVINRLIAMQATMRDADEKERLNYELTTVWKQLAADVVEAFVELGALIWIVLQIIDRSQPVGQFIYVQQLVSRALSQSSALARQLGRVDEDLANIVDYQRFMEIAEAPKKETTIDAQPETIAVSHVSFCYPKTDITVLNDVSLAIKKGQHVAIVGENGAGKSTLIKLLMGLYEPTKGKVLLDQQCLRDVAPESWHRFIGLLDQDFISYYFATIKENVMFGDLSKPQDTRRMAEAIDKAEFRDVVEKLDRGMDTYIQRWMANDNDEVSATELSGGQYQRLALARNFYRDSPVVILDEPTSAIDALAEARIFKYLFSSDKTVITISHRLSTVQKADVIFMMKQGKLVEQGSYRQLVAQDGEFVRMFESQIK